MKPRAPNRQGRAIAVALMLMAGPATATMTYKGIELTGNLESQTLIRENNGDTLQFIQNRNSLRIGASWKWLTNHRWLERYDSPGIESSELVLLYRGVYDSFYSADPGGPQHGQTRYDDLVGGPIGRLSSDHRRNLAIDNDLRAAYIDIALRQVPVRFRFGRQQVVWGESDYFRLMDIWNPLDVRWHFHQEPLWDELRVPLWLLKGAWDIGNLGRLNDTYLEVVYNPGDYQPAIISDFLPRPWALPFPDPLRSGQVQYDPVTRLRLAPQIDLQGTSTRKGDFQRNPIEASEVGARFHATTPQGIDFTLNYFYGRGRSVGAAMPFAVDIQSVELPAVPGFGGTPVGQYQIDDSNPGATVPVYPVNVKAKVVHPYMHIFGLTAKYFDAEWTGTSFRNEMAYVIGSPFHTIEQDKLAPVKIVVDGREINIPGLDLGYAPLGYTERDLWAGMVGVDRPNQLNWLNREAPWLITSQFFWTYVVGGHVDKLRGNGGVGEEPYFGPVGSWVSGPNAGQTERQQNARLPGNNDNIRKWELLFSLAATSMYWNGRIVPMVANVLDPINRNDAVILGVDCSLRNDVILSISERFFTDLGGNRPSNDPWFLGGRMHRRDELGIKLTYQF